MIVYDSNDLAAYNPKHADGVGDLIIYCFQYCNSPKSSSLKDKAFLKRTTTYIKWMTQQCEMCNLKPLEVCCLLPQLLSARFADVCLWQAAVVLDSYHANTKHMNTYYPRLKSKSRLVHDWWNVCIVCHICLCLCVCCYSIFSPLYVTKN